jgi:hypothetical protein
MRYDKGKIDLTEDENRNINEKANVIDYEEQTFYLKYIDPKYKSLNKSNVIKDLLLSLMNLNVPGIRSKKQP